MVEVEELDQVERIVLVRIDRFQRAPDELHVQLRGVLHVADGAAGLEERAPGHAAQAGQLKGHTVQNGFLRQPQLFAIPCASVGKLIEPVEGLLAHLPRDILKLRNLLQGYLFQRRRRPCLLLRRQPRASRAPASSQPEGGRHAPGEPAEARHAGVCHIPCLTGQGCARGGGLRLLDSLHTQVSERIPVAPWPLHTSQQAAG
mmetsp:Transcript_110258/g.154721  ORF Transcript_110258/g.154721 Transcript_110258/m.154721 type:complete len:202 (+) Transcript_110258:490-1095(+)